MLMRNKWNFVEEILLIYVIPFVLFERKFYLKMVLSMPLQILPFTATIWRVDEVC